MMQICPNAGCGFFLFNRSGLLWFQYWWSGSSPMAGHIAPDNYWWVACHLWNGLLGHTGLREFRRVRNPPTSSFWHCLLTQVCLLSSCLTSPITSILCPLSKDVIFLQSEGKINNWVTYRISYHGVHCGRVLFSYVSLFLISNLGSGSPETASEPGILVHLTYFIETVLKRTEGRWVGEKTWLSLSVVSKTA